MILNVLGKVSHDFSERNQHISASKYAEYIYSYAPATKKYTDMAADVAGLHEQQEHKNRLRETVIHKALLEAGTKPPPYGGIGTQAAPDFVPEVLHGAILSTSI